MYYDFINIYFIECFSTTSSTRAVVVVQRRQALHPHTKNYHHNHHHDKNVLLFYSKDSIDTNLQYQEEKNNDHNDDEHKKVEPIRIYFDISINNENIGRLIFNLNCTTTKSTSTTTTTTSLNNINHPLPKLTQNIIKLSTQELKSIDNRCTYINSYFTYSQQYIEYMPQYSWAHVCNGKGRNAIIGNGRNGDDKVVEDVEVMKAYTHSCYGGVYYGLNYDDIMNTMKNRSSGTNNNNINNNNNNEEEEEEEWKGVVLTVPLVGAYRGSTSFSIVRVGESPKEWKEKLLLNSAVLGWLESGMDVLYTMARQTNGPPMICGSGSL